MNPRDAITEMLCDHQRLGAQLDPYDIDARQRWIETGAQLLEAVHDPFLRLSHATSLAIVLVMRCPYLSSDVALGCLMKGW